MQSAAFAINSMLSYSCTASKWHHSVIYRYAFDHQVHVSWWKAWDSDGGHPQPSFGCL